MSEEQERFALGARGGSTFELGIRVRVCSTLRCACIILFSRPFQCVMLSIFRARRPCISIGMSESSILLIRRLARRDDGKYVWKTLPMRWSVGPRVISWTCLQ